MKRLSYVFTLFLVCGALFCDEIKLKDGTVLSGRVVSSNATSIAVEDLQGNATYLSVSDIEWISNQQKSADGTNDVIDPYYTNRFSVGVGIDNIWNGFALCASVTYERMFLTWFSIGGSCSISVKTSFPIPYFFGSLDISWHPFPGTIFNAYLGSGIAGSIYFGFGFYEFYLPLTIGCDIWFSKDLIVRIQDKICLASLKYQTLGWNELTVSACFGN